MLGQRIKLLRQARSIRQECLANHLGVSKQSISNWENENIYPSIEMLVRLADFFGVTTDYLLGREERRKLDITGLSDNEAAHLQQIVSDLLLSREASSIILPSKNRAN